jgi:glycosyltransferase involved in cell wall biosynthesis
VQRVSRALKRGLGESATALCFDPFEGAWRPLEGWERANIESASPAAGRGSRWPLWPRLRGHLRHLGNRPSPLGALVSGPDEGAGGLIVPEIFLPEVAAALPTLLAATRGPRIALFHDAVALQYPEFAPRSTVSRFPSYMRELLQFDGIAAVSEASKSSLLDYWKWLGVGRTPEVAAVTLGIDLPETAHAAPQAGGAPVVLCVASIEGRKNHAELLTACEQLWSEGASFQLRLVGLTNTETGGPAIGLIEKLRSGGRPIRYEGAVPDLELAAAYAACAFTVYPSLAEGFGLPIAESLARGKACVCRMEGALGEVARGGGCKGIGSGSAAEIAGAIGDLLNAPAEREELEAEAAGRKFKTWPEYTSELLQWMGSLKRLP